MVLLRLLRTLRSFDRFSDEMLTQAAALFMYREYPTNTIVSHEGATDSEVYIITQGEVRIFISTPPFTPPHTKPQLHPPHLYTRYLPKQVRIFTIGAGDVEVDLGYVKSTDAKPCGAMVGKVGRLGGATERPWMAV